ncbi:MAG: cell division protein ZapE [Beijerinckiaceae bacterium]|jgi:cell division protein ZapE|nr:cell division protein ZapE [Beijerinckiaceae bacterium]
MESAPRSVAAAYAETIQTGAIESDPEQLRVISELDCLLTRLEAIESANTSLLTRLFGSRKQQEPFKGLYIWGSVGRGKTMLMDMFFDAVPLTQKRRVHFHSFMAEVHAGIHAWRQAKKSGSLKGEDPISPVAEKLAAEARLLCFDEFSVTDIADAMILGRLFTALFGHGVVVVATSNVEPSRLYENGLNRALFLPFIRLLHERVDVVKLDARTDFRLEKLSGSPVYLVPADAKAKKELDALLLTLTGQRDPRSARLKVLGRDVRVPQAHGHIARFNFDDLCKQPLAAADYLAIAEQFHTILIDDIPVMHIQHRNEAKRFINLIDTLYDQNVKVIASAAAEPHELYLAEEGKEAFEFERTASRLIEMRSTDYLAQPHGRGEALSRESSGGIVET